MSRKLCCPRGHLQHLLSLGLQNRTRHHRTHTSSPFLAHRCSVEQAFKPYGNGMHIAMDLMIDPPPPRHFVYVMYLTPGPKRLYLLGFST